MIRVPEVRVIDDEGEQLGVMETEKAIALAEERALDLVEVSPTAVPPVCRITDFGKFKYEQSKRLKEAKKKQHTTQVKEIKLRPKIEEHDFQFKKRHAEEFLEKHHKVKFTVVFRGRELDHKELGRRILERMKKELEHIGVIERPAMFEGRLMTMFMAPPTSKGGPQPSKQKGGSKRKGGEATTKKKDEPPSKGEQVAPQKKVDAEAKGGQESPEPKDEDKGKEGQDAKTEVK